jgi:hypothetical protein
VYRAASTPVFWETQLLAASWANGAAGHVSHRAAAALWDLPCSSRIVEITTLRGDRVRLPDVICHESDTIHPSHVQELRGVPISTPARTWVDLAAFAPERALEHAAHRLVRRKDATEAELTAMVSILGARGRRGLTKCRSVLALGVPVTDSDPEVTMMKRLREHGFIGAVTQYNVFGPDGRWVARVDGAFVPNQVAMEYQSDEFHNASDRLAADGDRRLRLRRVGWEMLEVRKQHLRRGCFGPIVAALEDFGVPRSTLRQK